MLVGLLIAGVAIALTIHLARRLAINRTLPPGPSGLPFLGMLPWLQPRTAHLTLAKWAKDYGPLFSFWNGPRLVVVLADMRVMKEALLKQADVFTGRPRTKGGDLTHKNHGLLQSDGPLWKTQRRFALSTLRDFGFGKPILENRIKEETEQLTEEIRKLDGKPYDLQFLLNNSVSNIICALVFGQRFEYDDKKFLQLMDHFSFIATRNGQNIFGVQNFIEFIMYVRRHRMKQALKKMDDIEAFCNGMIKEHEESFNKDEEPEDYIHAFMAARANQPEGPTTFTDLQLLQSVISLFVAGTETTSTTLRWAILLLAQHPEIQDKVREEMSRVCGAGNVPNLSDKTKLPYVEATICEVQRIANLVPLSLPHRTEADTVLDGYNIPKDAIVIPLLWAAHRDPEVYPNPDKFDPSRFIADDGKVAKNDALVPFSLGKRACLGESLARMELFLYFTTLFSQFRFELAREESRNYENDRLVGVTSSPLNFDVCAIPL